MTRFQELVAQQRTDNLQTLNSRRSMLFDFFEGRQDKDQYLKNHGFKGIRNPLPLGFVNITKKIIKKTSLVYKFPPERKLSKNPEKYKEFIDENPIFDFTIQVLERLVNLLGNCLIRPVFTKRGFRVWLDTDWIPEFAEGDPFNPIGYSIPIKHDVTETNAGKVKEDWYIYYSDDEMYWYVPGTDKKKPDPTTDSYDNPLGIMPIVEAREEIPVEEYWPDGAMDLAKANQNININWNNINYALHYQAFDQPYVEGIDSDADINVERNFNKLWRAPQGGRFGLLGFDPAMSESMEIIQKQIQIISNAYNVSLDWFDQSQPQSGFALLVRNLDLLEDRQLAIQRWKMIEQKIYKIIQRQSEIYNVDKLPDAELTVDYPDVSFPLQQAEELERLEFNYKYNIDTPLSQIMSENPEFDEKQALKKYEENKKLNAKLTPQQQAFRENLEEGEFEIGINE